MMLKRMISFWVLVSAVALCACSRTETQAPHIGYVEADWVYVAAPQAGWITDQSVREGDEIDVGDHLFSLDVGFEEAALAEAKARLAQSQADARNIETGARAPEIAALNARLTEAVARLARVTSDRDRILPLVATGVEPAIRRDQLIADVDAASAAVEALRQDIAVAQQAGRPATQEAADAASVSAAASVESAQYRLSQRAITANLAGRVERVLLETGEYALPGAQVLAVQPHDGLKVRFFVPQSELPRIAIGHAVTVIADGTETPSLAAISYISSSAEFTPPVIYSRNMRDKLVFLVEADLPSESSLSPGLPVEVVW